jgi:hypothetical protein
MRIHVLPLVKGPAKRIALLCRSGRVDKYRYEIAARTVASGLSAATRVPANGDARTHCFHIKVGKRQLAFRGLLAAAGHGIATSAVSAYYDASLPRKLAAASPYVRRRFAVASLQVRRSFAALFSIAETGACWMVARAGSANSWRCRNVDRG